MSDKTGQGQVEEEKEKGLIREDYLTISPAYARDYTKGRTAESEFRQGLDFKGESFSLGGKYLSIRDFAKGTKVCIRYNKMTMVKVVTV